MKADNCMIRYYYDHGRRLDEPEEKPAAVAGKPEGTAVSDHPWRIEWHSLDGEAAAIPAEQAAPLPAEKFDDAALAESLRYRYPHPAAQRLASKLTATQLKGRNMETARQEVIKAIDNYFES